MSYSIAEKPPLTNRAPWKETAQTLRQLHSAIRKADLCALRNLLTESSDYSCLDTSYGGATALQLALRLDSEEICGLLLSSGASANVSADQDDNTLLHQASRQNQVGIVRVLLAAGADTEASNADGLTSLHCAAELGHLDPARLLVEAGCNLNRANLKGRSPLMTAALHGHLEIVELLVEAKCDLHWRDNERKNALMVATQANENDIVRFLINSGCELDAVDQYGRTALYQAAELGCADIVRQFIKANANINRADTRGCTPFTEAVANRHMDVAQVLVDAGCNVNTVKYETLEAPIHSAIKLSAAVYGQREMQLELVKRLLKAECDINAADKEGWTPLFHAAYGGEIEIVKLLLERKADVTKVTGTKDTLLHGAVYGNSPDVMELLIKAGCPVNNVNQKNELPLYTAIARRADNQNNREFFRCYQPLTGVMIRLLLEAGSQTDVCELKTHQSPLFVAIQQRYVEAVDLLIKAGCDVNLPNRDGNTPLWVACTKGSEEIVRTLLSHPNVNIDRGVQQVPLHAAAALGYTNIARLLLEAGCDVNKLSETGVSALYLAAEMNHFPVAQLLVRWGANPSAMHLVRPPSRCCRLYTDAHPHLELEPLYAAVPNDSFRMFKLIIDATPRLTYGVLSTLKDIVFRTPYAHEARLSQRTLVQFDAFFKGILKRPRSLKEECRGIVRENLGTNPKAKVDGLPLPGSLKEYVLLNGCSIMKEQDM